MSINYRILKAASVIAPMLVSSPASSAAPPSPNSGTLVQSDDGKNIGFFHPDGSGIACDVTDPYAPTVYLKSPGGEGSQITMTARAPGTPNQTTVITDRYPNGVSKGVKHVISPNGQEVAVPEGGREQLAVSDPKTLERDAGLAKALPAMCKKMIGEFTADRAKFLKGTIPPSPR